jgi:NAD(P)-dependent dehydrogenase (short-subunit alcohol dehydrogenase family)
MSQGAQVLICGAGSGIGLALVKKHLQDPRWSKVHATSRRESDALLSLRDQFSQRLVIHSLQADREEDYSELANSLKNHQLPLERVINTIGLLHDPGRLSPERKFEEIDPQIHLEVYAANVLPTLLLAKHLKEILRAAEAPVFVTISAKVGSISDNSLGGWHSYRMAKAALNMGLKNFSLEMGRLNKNSVVLALHPGTTETKLSEPFLAAARKKYEIHSPEQTADNLTKVIEGLKAPQDNGRFLSWDGTELPW